MSLGKIGRFVAAAICFGGVVAGSAAAGAAPSPKACRERNNSTTSRLLECIRAHALWQHLVNFQVIADQNPGRDGHGNRDTGTSGYRASVDYVAALMRKAGYNVTIQPYPWKTFVLLAPPAFRDGARAYRLEKDWFVARLSGSGSVTAPVQPAGAKNGMDAASGCSRRDFERFRRGNIALLQRGACEFDVQVANAQASGASAVVIYNNRAGVNEVGGKARNGGSAYQANLAERAAIPVIGVVSHAVGADLDARYRAGKAPRVSIGVQAEKKSDTDYNVIADSPFGDPHRTVVIEGHLDSIYGAGILDNGSGSATILEIARNMARTPTSNRLRYIWFGGEEIALLGSRYYTKALSQKQLRDIVFDVDADVTATPNFDILIADPGHAHNADKLSKRVLRDSQIGNRLFLDYFRTIGVASRIASFGNDGTDSIPFGLAGIPNTGILTQQNCCKKPWEVKLWGGFLGNYEGKVPGRDGGCVDNPRRWCDNLSNNNRFVFEIVSKATAYVTLKLANDASLKRK
ncbi:MAG: M28 family peptidase [Alphaproteobacteria bacterium]|nr:M28 family peptidase [Alphaproteobacteria bacterium]